MENDFFKPIQPTKFSILFLKASLIHHSQIPPCIKTTPKLFKQYSVHHRLFLCQRIFQQQMSFRAIADKMKRLNFPTEMELFLGSVGQSSRLSGMWSYMKTPRPLKVCLPNSGHLSIGCGPLEVCLPNSGHLSIGCGLP